MIVPAETGQWRTDQLRAVTEHFTDSWGIALAESPGFPLIVTLVPPSNCGESAVDR
jgi:hypothetical protein